MLIPSCFYGQIRNVKKETATVAKKLIAGESIENVISDYTMLDSKEFPNTHFFLGLSEQILCNEDSFHFPYLIWNVSKFLDKKFDEDFNLLEEKKQVVFLQLLEKDWSTLCLGEAQNSLFWNPLIHNDKTFDRRTRWLPFIKAMLKYWKIYSDLRNVEIGVIFADEPKFNHNIWMKCTTLQYILGNLGVPEDVMSAPLPKMDLKKIIDKYNILNINIHELPWH